MNKRIADSVTSSIAAKEIEPDMVIRRIIRQVHQFGQVFAGDSKNRIMNTDLISPKMHGFIDYAFAATLLFTPPLLAFNKKAAGFYRALASASIVYSALTDYPLGVKPVISYQQHHIIDCTLVGGLFMTMPDKDINEDRHTMAFHYAISAVSLITVLFTDWHANPHE